MKTFIPNRDDKKLSVLVDINSNAKSLVFVMHGLSGYKEQPHIQTIAQSFFEMGLTVVRFDTANTFGESEGLYEDATVSHYLHDLEDVIAWAKQQNWFVSPFVLSGHSVGGFCTMLYAEEHPQEICVLFPFSPVISGKLWMESIDEKALTHWKLSGWQIKESPLRPGLQKKLRFIFVEDILQYSLFPKIHTLTMPLFLAVGEKDTVTPPKYQQMFFDQVPSLKKKLLIIPQATHTFNGENELQFIRNYIQAIMKENPVI